MDGRRFLTLMLDTKLFINQFKGEHNEMLAINLILFYFVLCLLLSRMLGFNIYI